MEAMEKSVDPVALEMLKKTAAAGIETAFDRHIEQGNRCPFGEKGMCCKVCDMGPCRISLRETGAKRGVCGATGETIAARQLIRQVAAGAAAHSDHGHDVVKTLKLAAQGKAQGYSIKDPQRLLVLAAEWGVKTDGRKIEDIAIEMADLALNEFNQQEGEIKYPSLRAPAATLKIWRDLGLVPVGIEHEIVETLHRTHEGVDADYINLIMHGMRTSLGDGWAGAMLATDFGDVLFGSPKPVRSQVNLGVLKKDHVNIVVHGHEPTLSEMVIAASRDKELIALAKAKGASGILVGGICCTANEMLMRQGAPVVGNFLHQELAIATGAVDLMLVDVQCIMPALVEHAAKFHTKVITTSKKARIPGATHIQFEEEHALSIAKQIVKTAIENYPNRRTVDIPEGKTDLVAGFTVQNTFQHLGGRYRATFRPLNDGIISGRLRGVAAVIGCNTVRKTQDDSHIKMVKELIANDVLVVMTGCAATACAKVGLLQPEAAEKWAGPGLREICEAVGIPPVLHLGSCVDNSRILVALCEMIKEGGLGDKLSDLPVAGAAPEAMCEKAIAIGFYCVASGVYVNYSPAMRVLGSPILTKFLTDDIEEIVGGKFNFENDPVKAAQLMMAHMDKKRAALKLQPLKYSKSFLTAPATAEPVSEAALAAVKLDASTSGAKKGCAGGRP